MAVQAARIIYTVIKRLIAKHGFVKGVSRARQLGFKPKQIQKAFKKPDLDRVNKNALDAANSYGLQMPENADRLFATVKVTNPKLAKTYDSSILRVKGKPIRSMEDWRKYADISKKQSIKRGDFSTLIDDASEISDFG